MVDIEKYADGTALFDGQYKLLRCLSDAGGTADVWLALAVKTIDTLGNYSEDDEYSPDENTGMKVAIKIYRLQGILDIDLFFSPFYNFNFLMYIFYIYSFVCLSYCSFPLAINL